jgi:hypothetical protein
VKTVAAAKTLESEATSGSDRRREALTTPAWAARAEPHARVGERIDHRFRCAWYRSGNDDPYETAMHAPRNPFVIYALFIGTPLLLLAVVLLIGRRMGSPVSVGGEWKIDPDSMKGDCAAVAASDKPPTMQISQMGSKVTVRLGDEKIELRGAIDGNVVDAKPKREGARVLEMRAQVDEAPGHGSMTGTFRVNGCPDTQFQASRDRPGQPKEALDGAPLDASPADHRHPRSDPGRRLGLSQAPPTAGHRGDAGGDRARAVRAGRPGAPRVRCDLSRI